MLQFIIIFVHISTICNNITCIKAIRRYFNDLSFWHSIKQKNALQVRRYAKQQYYGTTNRQITERECT